MINRFSSWNEVLQAAGLLPVLPQRTDTPSDDDLLIDIITVTRKLKKIPSTSEMIAHGKYSRKPYDNRWGSFTQARETAYTKAATTKDDLALMKESEFLDILAMLSVIGKNVKEQLKNNCLSLRNACGHPNSFKIGRGMVESYLEILLLNVYESF